MQQVLRKIAGLILWGILLCTSILPAQAAVTESCQSTPVLDPRVKGRARVVTFPDGRELTIVGHHHGYRQVYDIYALAVQGRLEKMSDEEFAIFLQEIRKANNYQLPMNVSQSGRRSLIQWNLEKSRTDISDFISPQEGYDIGISSVLLHALEDFSFLKDVLEKKLPLRTIQFVGNEALDQESDLMAQQMAEALQALKLEIWNWAPRIELNFSIAQMTNVYISMMNGHNYLYLVHPELVKNIPNVGVESTAAIDLYNREQTLSTIDKTWKQRQQADDRYWQSRSATEKDLFKSRPEVIKAEVEMNLLNDDVSMMIVNSQEKLSQKIKQIDTKLFPWLEKETAQLLEAYQRRIYVNHRRDFDSAVNMVSRYESGIHFVGLNHLSSRVRILEELCQQEFDTVTSQPWFGGRPKSQGSKKK